MFLSFVLQIKYWKKKSIPGFFFCLLEPGLRGREVLFVQFMSYPPTFGLQPFAAKERLHV